LKTHRHCERNQKLDGVATVKQSKEFLTVVLENDKNIDLKVISTMSNSKLDLIQSISEQQQQADQLQASLQQLSQTLINFEQLIEQSEKPITSSTILLHEVQRTTIALESRISSILTEIGNLSPQAIKTLTASYTEQIELLQTKLANINIADIESEIEHRFVFNINSRPPRA
jgi:chromosome segregation ATPase